MVQTFPKPKIKTSINKLYLRGQEKAPAICFMLYLSVFLFFKTLFIKTHSSLKIFTDTGCVLSYSRVSVKLPICISSPLVTGNTKYLLLLILSS